ncbi:MAG: hypothetical protein HKN79_02620 [Flavobacteriales bacterium]|nr:hypothetical protein [Flavobacteriales bacterium]
MRSIAIKFSPIIALLLLFACKKESAETLIIDPCGIDYATTVHYGAVGDEFSSGLYIHSDSAWTDQIAEYIESQGHVVSAYEQIGEYGDLTSALSMHMELEAEAKCKNLITLMCGAHDHWSGRTSAEFQTDFAALLIKAISRTDDPSKVICVTLPDYSSTPGLPTSAGSPEEAQAMIEAYNQVIISEAQSRGARIADIYPISQSAYQFLYVPEDSLHASADQHAIWANVIAEQVAEALD